MEFDKFTEKSKSDLQKAQTLAMRGNHQSLEPEDFAWATRAVLEVARRACRGMVVSSLEGGYDLEGLSRSAVAHLEALGED